MPLEELLASQPNSVRLVQLYQLLAYASGSAQAQALGVEQKAWAEIVRIMFPQEEVNG